LFFSYTMSVILLSLSMYGIWCFIHDTWQWWLGPHFVRMPSCSFLIVIRNLDEQIEDVFRYVAREIENTELECDIVAVDVSSNDFTAAILERVASNMESMKVMTVTGSQRPIHDAMALCRGKVVHVLDLSNRMSAEECIIAICALLRQERQELLIRRIAK